MKKLQSLLATGALIGVYLFLLSTSAYSALAEDYRVTNQAEFWALSEKLRPGDNIILGNGIWTDFVRIVHRLFGDFSWISAGVGGDF